MNYSDILKITPVFNPSNFNNNFNLDATDVQNNLQSLNPSSMKTTYTIYKINMFIYFRGL